jgi:Protein of unknown function (DUF732)
MRKVIYLLIWAAAALLGTGTAHADEESFLNDMAAAGFTNNAGNNAEISVGLNICSEVAGGESGYTAAHQLWLDSQIVGEATAQRFVEIAVRDLCPMYWHGGNNV